MPKIHIVTDQGELVQTLEAEDYDLTTKLSQLHLLLEIAAALKTADLIEAKEALVSE